MMCCYLNKHYFPSVHWFCFNILNMMYGGSTRGSCIELKALIPIEHPFGCSTTKTRNESVVIQCCESYNMCNRDLILETHTKPPGRPAVALSALACSISSRRTLHASSPICSNILKIIFLSRPALITTYRVLVPSD